MITLNLSALNESRWVDMPQGVRLKLRPVTTAVRMAAQTAARTSLEGLDEAARGDAALMTGLGFQTLLECLARYAVEDWDGVADQDGTPLPVTPEALAALMRLEEIAHAFFVEVMRPAETVAMEGNVSGPAPRGTSAPARNTAGAAKRSARRAGKNARMNGKRPTA